MTEIKIGVGEPCRITTKDGRTYVGVMTGYAEVATGDEEMEEIYLDGIGRERITIAVRDIDDITPDGYFSFRPEREPPER